MTAWAGFWSLLTGTLGALATYLLYEAGVLPFDSDLEESFWGAGVAFVLVAIVAAILTPLTSRKPDDELRGLVYGLAGADGRQALLAGDARWYRSPLLLGGIALALSALLYLPVL
ncbi:hypothetical protein [Plantactinospora sp. KLBMP9567]|uniref:hypothetical protein n=1 Tax=Plantactinospora sp. KLBMP9567 TaxID=3085900 RepID=UPI002980FCB1|nr:hypothetical protein [Plantactinospora sp. KLBMP9567]MDW5323480.1 hypothetical protein [Plantactinospora sp. KLBMP9567]